MGESRSIMTPNVDIMAAVEQLDHTVTVGDVAVQTGLNIQTVENDLLFLASESGAHLQVSETGDVVYRFPQNLKSHICPQVLLIVVLGLWTMAVMSIFNLILYNHLVIEFLRDSSKGLTQLY